MFALACNAGLRALAAEPVPRHCSLVTVVKVSVQTTTFVSFGCAMKPRLLIVDDDPDILTLLSTALGDEGFDITTTTNAADFRAAAQSGTFELFLIDVTLRDGNGFSLVKELRRFTERGIILLTGRTSETDHVVGLEIGADDYVTKPFRIRELAARVNAVHRRTARRDTPAPQSIDMPTVAADVPTLAEPAPPSAQPDILFDGYRLSESSRRLWNAAGEEIEMTTAEFELLLALLRRRGQVLSRDQLMNAIKGRDWESYDRAIDGLVSRVRRKIPRAGGGSPYIRTVHGIGYSFAL